MLIDNYMLNIGVAVAGLFLLGGYAFKTKHIYAYYLLTLALFVVRYFIIFTLYCYLTALGILILISELFMMISFVNKYPPTTGTAEE